MNGWIRQVENEHESDDGQGTDLRALLDFRDRDGKSGETGERSSAIKGSV